MNFRISAELGVHGLPEILYIKGIDNTVADAISQLDFTPALLPHQNEKGSKIGWHSQNAGAT